jgi:5,10-methylenetetrahydrofolate reductase
MNEKIMYEVVPPSKRSSEQYRERAINSIADSLSRMKPVGILDIPEIVEENYCGRPYYRNLDNREFASVLKKRISKDIVINKVVPYFNPKQKFEEWLDETAKNHKIDKFVFVGGTFKMDYPGPTVIEANRLARSKGLTFGNIAIPTRPNEAANLAGKTSAGCNFFTTQILLDSENISKVIIDYAEECRKRNLKPSRFYLSFSPISDIQDIEFFEWLGVHIDEATKLRLMRAANAGDESVKIAQDVYSKIISKTDGIVPIGVNIEQVALHNLQLSEKLVDWFSDKG